MRSDPVRILLVQADADERRLVEEALAEISERCYQSPCLRRCEATPASNTAQALDLVRRAAFDVALVDLAGTEGPMACTRLLDAARDLPVIVLASPEDEALALGFIRRGVQDYILKTEIDCLPLARALCVAMERQRLLAGWRGLAMVDEMTGLPNAAAFESLSRRHWDIAACLGMPLVAFLVEIESAEPMQIIEAADVLRGVFRAGDVLARAGENRFAAVAIETGDGVASRIRSGLEIPLRAAIGMSRDGMTLEELLDSAERSLWENGLAAAGQKSGAAFR